MAEGVQVNVSDAAIISALNTPGGGVFEWRDEVADRIARRAESLSPVNDLLNCLHRGGERGSYKAGWRWDALGSNQHRVRATIYNNVAHSVIVEYGKGPSFGRQTFSWTGFDPPGSIQTVKRTRGRVGKFVLTRATREVMGGEGVTV